MNIKIVEVKDNKDHNKERLVLHVLEDDNIGNYIVFDTTYADGKISNKLRHTHLFEKQKVKKGDIIVLYTKKGNANIVLHENGKSSTYFFYWGLDNSVWNNEGDSALLIHMNNYEIKKVGKK